MSANKTRDIEMVVWNLVRNGSEARNNHHVPLALKYLLVQYSKRIIGCNLLSIKDDIKFFKLLSTMLGSIKRLKLLYRASDHRYSSTAFHALCDNKGPTITIIKSNWGNVFGGYTSKSWSSKPAFHADPEAFLFLIRSNDKAVQNKCPMIFNLKETEFRTAVFHSYLCGPSFGLGHDISTKDNCNKRIDFGDCFEFESSYTNFESYEMNGDISLCGGKIQPLQTVKLCPFKAMDYHVYQIMT